MKTVALVTFSKLPKLFGSDNLLIDPFKKHGFKPLAVPWDKRDVSWENFDLVILRSCWNYHTRIPEFHDWLNKLESLKVNLWNPVNVIRWNMNKKYLLDLEKKGVPIIPTLLFNKEAIKDIRQLIDKKRWKEVVIKPAIGASAYKILKVNSRQIDSQLPYMEKVLQETEIIIQPFMEEVITMGEFSFVFINKKYSHAVLKKPKKDEFRSQIEFGGTELAVKPPPQLISQTQQAIDKIKSSLLYTRIDGLNIDGKLQIMEMELIEPDLFFKTNKNAVEKFVEAAVYLNSIR